MDATFELAFAGLETAEAAVATLRSDGFDAELRTDAGASATVVVTLAIALDEVDALSRVQSLARRLGGELVAHWQSEGDAKTRLRAVRGGFGRPLLASLVAHDQACRSRDATSGRPGRESGILAACRILELISPGGFERFFEELVVLTDPTTPETIGPIAGRYGLEMRFETIPELVAEHGTHLARSGVKTVSITSTSRTARLRF